MKGILLTAFVFLSALSSFAQWHNLGEHYTTIQMVGNGIGYRFENTQQFPTPHSAYTYSTIVTTNDWITEQAANVTNGTGEGCCTITAMSFYSMSSGIRSRNSQGFQFIEKTTDYGQTWQSYYNLGSNTITFFPMNLEMTSDTSGYFTANYGTSQSKFCRYTDSDISQLITWDTLMFNSMFVYRFSDNQARCNMEFVNDSTGFIAMKGNSGLNYLLRTFDFGNNWNIVATNADYKYTAINFPDDTTGYASTENGGLYKTIDGGLSWVGITSPTNSTINDLGFASNKNGYMVCDNGEIYRTADGGTSWITENSGVTSDLISIQVIDSSCAYTITSDGVLLKNTDIVAPVSVSGTIAIYPNPASETVNIITPDDTEIEQAEIYDHSGRLVMKTNLSAIDISQFRSGIYVINVKTTDQIIISRFIKY